MVGLGTIFIAILALAALQLFRGKLFESPILLWALMLALPLPFIANTAGWITAEVGGQPWLIYGMMRTRAEVSPLVCAGSAWFTLLGFLGMYTILGMLFVFLVYCEIEHGPGPEGPSAAHPTSVAAAAD
jgi:cytochrome d ubiquinol oxidase subunit I